MAGVKVVSGRGGFVVVAIVGCVVKQQGFG